MSMELLQCIRHLGFSRGWKYWRLQCAARKDPTIVNRMIKNLSKQIKNASSEQERTDLKVLKVVLVAHYKGWCRQEGISISPDLVVPREEASKTSLGTASATRLTWEELE